MRMALALTLALPLVAACATKTTPVANLSTPRFPDFVAPNVPPALAGTPAAINQDRGWALLQAGELDLAEREFQAALEKRPAFHPAEIALGYLELARKHPSQALAHFARALAVHQADVSALVGRGEAHVALGHDEEALAAFEAAAAADPASADIGRRVDILKFRSLEADLRRAREAVRAGRLDEAVRMYRAAIAASPDSPLLYRELAGVEREKGDGDSALEHLRHAVSLDPSDARSLVMIGELLEERGDFDGAVKAYRDALAIEPGAEMEAKVDAAMDRAELARLPAAYRTIDQAPQIVRADLAALIGVRLAPLLDGGVGRRPAVLITDIKGHWATAWIVRVAQAGVMEPFANHTFQPRAVVRRSDLALAVSRLLAVIAAREPGRDAWAAARLQFPDLPSRHLAYRAASAAVTAGVLQTLPDNRFQPARVVSGPEAVEAIGRLQALAGIPTRGGQRP